MWICLLALPMNLLTPDEDTVIAASNRNISDLVKTVKTPDHSVAMLGLYTSEGCSSSPRAISLLTELNAGRTSDKRLVPMSYHLTYWDHIGWIDRFANKQFDLCQRNLADKMKKTGFTHHSLFFQEKTIVAMAASVKIQTNC